MLDHERASARVLLVGARSGELGGLLASDGCSVSSTVTGEEALARLAHENADVVLTDVALSGLSGRDLCRVLRADVRASSTAILLVARAEERLAPSVILESRADGLVLLPIDAATLSTRVRTALAGTAKPSDETRPEIGPNGKSSSAHPSSLAIAAFEEALRVNAALCREVEQLRVAQNALQRYATRIETEMELTESRFRVLARGARDGFFVTDARGVLLDISESAQAMIGRSRAEVVGRPLFQAVDLAPELSDEFFHGLTTTSKGYELLLRGDTPEKTWLELTGSELSDGRDQAVLIVARDITERKRTVDELRATEAALRAAMAERAQMEAELVQAQKLEAVGQLAAGIAHEINTPTQYIGDNVQFLRTAVGRLGPILDAYADLAERAKRGEFDTAASAALDQAVQKGRLRYLREQMPKAIDQSLEGVERVATIVQAMKEFSHPGTAEKSPIDINHAVRITATVARNEWKMVADLEFQLEEALPLVPCLPGELNQTILNVIVNAAHAIADKNGGEKGQITITTRQAANFAEIRISDSGGGIPEAIRDKIFNPFFTTKKVGKGTGQGLAIARSVIVDKHQGRLFFETQAGVGTTFVIQLPLGELPADGGAE